MSTVQIATHVFTVEFHVYIYHLIDNLPGFDLPKLVGVSNGFEHLDLEDLEVTLIKVDGTQSKYYIKFPKRFTDVLDSYLFEKEIVYFPSYEYHTLSKNGVVLRNAVLQTCTDEVITLLIPELMLSVELGDIRTIRWSTLTREFQFAVDLNEVVFPPRGKPKPPPAIGTRRAIFTDSMVDLRPLCPPIKNQGDLGTCGVTAVTTFVEFLSKTSLSVLFIYYTSRVFVLNNYAHDDSGVDLSDIIEALSRFGICRNELWPYDTSKFGELPPQKAFDDAQRFKPTDFMPVATLDAMKAALRSGVPVVLDIDFAPSAFGHEPLHTGQIGKPPAREVEYCDHTVVLVGYNDDTEDLIFQNSWGIEWGDKGFGYISYEYILQGHFKHAYTWRGDFPNNVVFE